MTDDLVNRLREVGDRNGLMYEDYDTTVEAADRIEKLEAALVRSFNHMMEDGRRIEQLEAALREIVDCVTLPAQNDFEMREIARKALEDTQ